MRERRERERERERKREEEEEEEEEEREGMPCCSCKGEGTCVRCACTTSGRPCDDCYPARRNRCQNSAPPSASFNLPVVQSNDENK